MVEFIITRGFPASGKSTWAEAWVNEDPENRVQIERDKFRVMLPVYEPNAVNEKWVTSMVNQMLEYAWATGKSVVVSDTNLRVRYVKDLLRWAVAHGYDKVALRDFTAPREQLLERNRVRARPVPEDVLLGMMKKFPEKNWPTLDAIWKDMENPQKQAEQGTEPFKNSPVLPPAVLVDIDGTLAHMEGKRDPYDLTKVHLDAPDTEIISLVRSLHERGDTIILMSGRSEEAREGTVQWLAKHKVPYDELHMRKEGDYRKDSVVKDELVREHIQDFYYVRFCLDDRNQVVDHYRACGYKVLQVAPGDF